MITMVSCPIERYVNIVYPALYQLTRLNPEVSTTFRMETLLLYKYSVISTSNYNLTGLDTRP